MKTKQTGQAGPHRLRALVVQCTWTALLAAALAACKPADQTAPIDQGETNGAGAAQTGSTDITNPVTNMLKNQ